MRKLIITILLALIPSFACAGEVITVGQGSTLEAAIHSAMRAAIEQEVGALVESKTLVKDRQTIVDDIMINSSGLIEGYEVLSQTQSNGIFEVKVRSNVNEDRLQTGLMTVLQKKTVVETNMNDPRIAVIALDDDGKEYAEVENEIISSLQGQGFSRLIDLQQLDSSLKMRLKNSGSDPDLRKSIENQYHVDYLINVQVKLLQTENTSAVVLSPRMISVNNGEIIYSGTFTGNSRMFSNSGLEGAIKSASKQAAYGISNAALKHAAQVEQHITIIVTEETMRKFNNDLESISNQIKSLRGVRNVFKRSVLNGVTQLDLNFDGTAPELVAELNENGFTVIEMASEYIKI
ncbi:MAG: hypothetical protein IJ862_01075 [Selenomonadaceae bacterium]|nr:hypothetical protein [Selenomonadaceae bacterium]